MKGYFYGACWNSKGTTGSPPWDEEPPLGVPEGMDPLQAAALGMEENSPCKWEGPDPGARGIVVHCGNSGESPLMLKKEEIETSSKEHVYTPCALQSGRAPPWSASAVT